MTTLLRSDGQGDAVRPFWRGLKAALASTRCLVAKDGSPATTGSRQMWLELTDPVALPEPARSIPDDLGWPISGCLPPELAEFQARFEAAASSGHQMWLEVDRLLGVPDDQHILEGDHHWPGNDFDAFEMRFGHEPDEDCTGARTYWHLDLGLLDDPGSYEEDVDRRRVETLAEANLIGSERECGCHSPVLDLDIAAQLVPSSTPGHSHLYLDGVRLSWAKYEALLNALADAGVIEPGYAEASIRRKGSFVRKPGVHKPVERKDS